MTGKEYIKQNMQMLLDKGIVNIGDTSEIKSVLDRLQDGGQATIAFIGGSITQGCLASTEEKQYTHIVTNTLQLKFPGATILYLNAPIGGTDSQLGVARVERDILSHEPDMLIIEFSVNDANKPFYQETYEGLIRKVLKAKKRPAVLLLMNFMYDCLDSAEAQHLPLAKHYHLPAVSMAEGFGQAVREGNVDSKDITVDNLHPNDDGHGYVADLVLNILNKIQAGVITGEPYGKIPEPLTENRFENSNRLQNYNCEPELKGFKADRQSRLSSWYYFAEGWTASEKGDGISFKLKARTIAIQYRKSAKHPAPVAKAVIDGDSAHPVILDANFDQDWGDCLFLQMAAENLDASEHTVDITLTETHPDDTAAFYLVSIITT